MIGLKERLLQQIGTTGSIFCETPSTTPSTYYDDGVPPGKQGNIFKGVTYSAVKPKGCPAACNSCLNCPVKPDCNYGRRY